MLGTHYNVLDHEILETNNPNTLVFVDSSSYIEEPERPLLEILLPGYNRYVLANYDARLVNVFNSGTLGLNKIFRNEGYLPLPDGIWEIKQKICPYQYLFITKKTMRVTLLLQKVAQLNENIDLTECRSQDDKDLQFTLTQIYALIESAKLTVNLDAKKAYDDYQLANRLTDNLLSKFCKHCR